MYEGMTPAQGECLSSGAFIVNHFIVYQAIHPSIKAAVVATKVTVETKHPSIRVVASLEKKKYDCSFIF